MLLPLILSGSRSAADYTAEAQAVVFADRCGFASSLIAEASDSMCRAGEGDGARSGSITSR
jgi:hypothetical protein